MGNLNLLNWCQSTLPKQASLNKLICGDDSKSVVQGVFSALFGLTALILGCRASGKLRELSRAPELFCPSKSHGLHRLRHSPPQ
ncbi:hypothetical protein N7516_001400 [Penicillium verrucosum]|uniref:uncharacterized protein n=1 Tax=Penicillium verrucosum TaxID=60171 RepID=UPI002544FB42|nr:uncharacterized protein N7516_001400 [Penicillium verrucosum]KAJ5941232.1 hypothetical protein N7516_001400 [Penicillium verrucosum]